jgi:hypothetical protein
MPFLFIMHLTVFTFNFQRQVPVRVFAPTIRGATITATGVFFLEPECIGEESH